MNTQVAIVGGGPSGSLLSLLLHRRGIDNVVLERATRERVLARVRAGVLERGTVALLHEAGVGSRLDREGLRHDGMLLAFDQQRVRIDLVESSGHGVVVYGQTEVTRDLYEARESAGLATLFETDQLVIHDADGECPRLSWNAPDGAGSLNCEYVVGCDGFHGVSRRAIPDSVRSEYEKVYPFGWLGVLSQTPPVHDELIYASGDSGFALCSMRNANLSRYYVQCSPQDRIEQWSDDRFWHTLATCLPDEFARRMVTGPSVEKSIVPLRSFVCEPMSWGRLFLCGDAAHIVPPTGAKGLNLACGDVHYLTRAFDRRYNHGDSQALAAYSDVALERVWKSERFAWWMTELLHRFPDRTGFDQRMQLAEFAHLRDQAAARQVLAQNYVGLPF